jgi:MFS family permease
VSEPRLRLVTARTFRSLQTRNYRLFFTGQLVSVIGTWMQTVAQSWLVLTLTGSGLALGVATALQFLPMLLFGAWGGLIADRFDKRRLLVATQTAAGLLALVLGLLVVADVVTLWMVYVLALLLGAVSVVDMPTRQAFVTEMVGSDEVSNAVGLNSAVFNTGRLVGPAAAGLLVASVGVGPCFLLNALSYVGVVAGLRAMRVHELHRQAPLVAGPGQVRAGLRYVWSTPELRSTLLLVAAVGTFGLNQTVILPLLARYALGGGVRLYGLLSSMIAAGSLAGALLAANRRRPSRRLLLGSAAAFGFLTVVAAMAPSPLTVAVVLVPTGLATLLFLASANSTLQLASAASMRGRVMALYGLVLLGSNPVGGPLLGWVSGRWGPRVGMGLGGVVTLAAALAAVATRSGRRWPRLRPVAAETGPDPAVSPLPVEAA